MKGEKLVGEEHQQGRNDFNRNLITHRPILKTMPDDKRRCDDFRLCWCSSPANLLTLVTAYLILRNSLSVS